MKFWEDNRLDKEYSLTKEEIGTAYIGFLSTKEINWIKYYGHQTVQAFVGDKDGLNSVTDIENYSRLQEMLMPLRHKYVDSVEV